MSKEIQNSSTKDRDNSHKTLKDKKIKKLKSKEKRLNKKHRNLPKIKREEE